MILTALIIGGLIIGVGLIAAFWKKIKSWVERAINYIKSVIKLVVRGLKIFFQKVGNAIKQLSKNYSKGDMNKWQETIVTRQVSVDEVPLEIREKVSSEQVDFTKEFELQLS
jgi:hypothetical protein